MSFWHVFRVRLSATLSELALKLGPREYREWVYRVMEVGTRTVGSDPCVYAIAVQREEGEPVAFEFVTRAEATAFARGIQYATTGNPGPVVNDGEAPSLSN